MDKTHVTITNGFNSCGEQFKPPTSSTLSFGEAFRFWDMFISEVCHYTIVVGYGRHVWKGLHWYVRQLTSLNWMISLGSLTISVIWNVCVILVCSCPSEHGMVCSSIWRDNLWMITTNSFVPMRFILKSGEYIGRPTMCLLLKYLWSQHFFPF
jgi:hypothetical protein